MAGKTLLSVLSRANEFTRILDESLDKIEVVIRETEGLIREEFRPEFRKTFADTVFKMPSVEFIAYWESDEQCQAVMRRIFSSIVEQLEIMTGILRDIANWTPPIAMETSGYLQTTQPSDKL